MSDFWRRTILEALIVLAAIVFVILMQGCDYHRMWCWRYSQSAMPPGRPTCCVSTGRLPSDRCCTWRIRGELFTYCAVGCNGWVRQAPGGYKECRTTERRDR